MKTVDSPWPVRSCQPTALTVPTLSLLFVLNKLTPFCNTLCLEILFQTVLRLPQQLFPCFFTSSNLKILKEKHNQKAWFSKLLLKANKLAGREGWKGINLRSTLPQRADACSFLVSFLEIITTLLKTGKAPPAIPKGKKIFTQTASPCF